MSWIKTAVLNLLLILLLFALNAAQAQQCRYADILSPVQGARITDTQPTIHWRPIYGIEDYRLQMEGRMPESGVVWTMDVVVQGNTYQPTQPLTDHIVSVKVIVTAGCPANNQQDLGQQAARFLIQSRARQLSLPALIKTQ